MKSIAIGQFKARCLRLVEEVRAKHERLLLTKRGKPVAQVVPIDTKTGPTKSELIGSILFEKDIISPLDEPWEVLK